VTRNRARSSRTIEDVEARAQRQTDDLRCDAGLTAVFGLLGKRWSGLIIGTLLEGPARFGALASAIPGITESMLSTRLAELQAAGLVRRDVVEGPPVGTIYRLTDAGAALRKALDALAAWANEYLPPA
jgi:DNA-binding HxlR family transcriptional regulator